MKRASEVPPEVERFGVRPVTSFTAALQQSTNGPAWVRKASPPILLVRVTEPLKPSPAASHSAWNQSARDLPVWLGLKRMFSLVVARAGMTLPAVLPTSMVVTSRLETGNSG